MSNPAAKHPWSRRHLAAALVCAAAGIVLFQWFGNATRGYVQTGSLFWWWSSQWLNPSAETEHGWLILAVSLGLLGRNMKRGITDEAHAAGGEGAAHSETHASRFAQSSHRPAFVAMLGGLALHAVGFGAQQSRISIVALLIFTWGVVRLAGGRRWGSAALFPLGFMVFAIPLSVLDEIGLPLRLWVTSAGERIAQVAGIEVLRSGTQLVAPDGRFHYDVAAPCSGVRSLVALTALSLLVGYLNFSSWWRRALVVGICFPLVYLGNVVRIVAIVLAAQWGGAAWGERAHEVMGYGVFVIVLGGVLAGVSVMRRWWPETERWKAQGERRKAERETWRTEVTMSAVVVAVAVGEMFFLQQLASAPPRGKVGVVLAADGQNPIELPAFLGTEWIGQRVEVSAVEREILPADTGFSRKNYAFVADRKRDVFLSIVVSGRDRTSIHRPELCLVGQGWTIAGTARHEFRYPVGSEGERGNFPATVLHVRREMPAPRGGKVVVPQLVAYWFIAGDAVVASHLERFMHDAWNRVAHARADRWAYVLLQTDAADGEAAALGRLQAVIEAAVPTFQRPTRN